MSEKPHHSPESSDILRKVTSEIRDAFGQEFAAHIDPRQSYSYHDLARLPKPVSSLIMEISDIDAAGDSEKRRAFIRGALFITRMIHFTEEIIDLRAWYEKEGSIDDGGVAIPPPSIAPGVYPPADVLFRAPPDPEPRPEA